jgi:hypothetical protein
MRHWYWHSRWVSSFVGLILHSALCTGLGALAIVIAILVWLWPQRRLGQVGEATHV